MTPQRVKAFAVVVALGATIIVGAYKKEAHAPSLEPMPADESASIYVDPESIPSGGAASLTWRTKGATNVSVEGIGAVPSNGSQSVSPAASTTYRLTAEGAGGTMAVTTRLTVTEPSSPQPISQAVSASGN